MIPDDNPDTGSKAETTESSSGTLRPRGRSRYPRGRRRPRRGGRPPRPVASEAATDLPAGTDTEGDERVESRGASETSPPIPRSRTDTASPAPPVPKGRAIYAAIEKVEAIIADLKEVLSEMEVVMEYLEDVERQQITDEREIEVLRSRLESLHRRADRSLQHRRHEPRREPQPPPRQEHQDEGPEGDPS